MISNTIWPLSRYFAELTHWIGSLVLAGSMLLGSVVPESNVQEQQTLSGPDRIAGTVDPQRASFEHLTPAESLSSPVVSTVLQDSQGYLWFGTEWGLNRYDGYDFKVYTNKLGDPASLSFDSIRALYEDSTGILWVGGSGGLDRFNRSSETFVKIDGRGQVNDILQDNQGMLWVGFWHGLYGYEPDSGELLSSHEGSAGISQDPNKLANGNVRVIFEDSKGRLWLGTDGGLDLFDHTSGTFTHHQHHPLQPDSLSGNVVTAIFEDSQGALWIGTSQGVNRLLPGSQKFTRYIHSPERPFSLVDYRVSAITEDSSGRLWVGTMYGLSVYDRHNNIFNSLHHDPYRVDSLGSDTVIGLFVDAAGVLWAATNRGLSKYNRRAEQFVYYPASFFQNSAPEMAANSQFLTGCRGDDGLIWLGMDDGRLIGFNHLTGEQKIYHRELNRSNLYNSDHISALAVNPDGGLWVGTGSGWLEQFDPETGVFEPYKYLTDHPIGLIHHDLSGSLWVGTAGDGLFRLETDGRVNHYVHFWRDPDHWLRYGSLSHHIITAFYVDQKGVPWIGTWLGGINLWDSQKDGFSHLRHDPDDPASLSHDHVLAISEAPSDNPDVVWVGTLGGGLNRYDRQTDEFISYNSVDGLPGDSVSSIVPDNAGFLWLGTSQGLTRFDPKNLSIQNFDRRDGFDMYLPQCFASQAYFLCGNQAGFYIFDPLSFGRNTHIPPVVLTAVTISGEQLAGDLGTLEHLKLNYKNNDLAFGFAALDYSSPEKNQYAFRMEGLDQDWVHSGTRRYAEYRSLAPGEYLLRVKGSNNDYLWNEQGVALRITIQPPFWQTWGFGILFFLGFVVLVLFIFRWRLRAIRTRAHQLEAQVSSRTAALKEANLRLEGEILERRRAETALAQKAAHEAVEAERNRLARELHDAVTQTLFSASLIAEVLPRLWRKDEHEGRRRLSELGELARGALAEMRMLLLELRPAGFAEADMADLIRQLAESTHSRARLDIEVGITGKCSLPTDIKLVLFRIIQEALNNIVKHSGANLARLTLECDSDQLVLLVEDDGCGFDPENIALEHLGLGIMRERAAEIGAEFIINSHPSSGVQIIVVVQKPFVRAQEG
ncbi:two-component regulator propeller domain-containing protein [Chloroflexota bacterium]